MKRILLAMIGLMFLACCMIATKGSRINESDVKQIQIGKTTQSDILKMFGVPDRIIDAGTAAASKSQTVGDVNVPNNEEVIVDKNQEIFIYEYEEENTVVFYFVMSSSEKRNTLMVWMDKDTGIVQDYGYKREIK
jgi:hypothetical protein